MYFADTKNDTFTNAVIIRKIHLVKGLKANLLIENDILNSKMIDISNSTKSIYIDSCDVTISIITKTDIRSQCRSVHALKAFMISSKSKCLISVHNIVSLSNRDFLFESWETINLFIYAHILDFETSFILIRNDQNRVIKISRNFRLSTITELDYFSAYQADSENVLKLAIRHFKLTHKIFWFSKVVTAFTTFAVSNDNSTIINDFIVKQNLNDLILFNEIIIHNFSQEAITSFTSLVNKYFDLWIDQDFVDLSMKNWMKISLKTDWENKIKDKTKVYSMRIKNKEFLNKIFDKLHQQNKLSWTTQSTSFFFSCFVVWREVLDQKKARVVVDIRDLNAVVQSNAYSVSLQFDILTAVSDCNFISIIDCSGFFYQWKVHSSDRHKLTVITHRDQKSFNVVVMNYRNSSAYVQRQIDRILRNH